MHYIKSLKYLFSVLAILSVFANAHAEDFAEQKLMVLLAKLDSYSGRFEQVVEEDDGYTLDENSGVMSFERPSKLYWRVAAPFPNLLVSDGDQVYFYDPDLDQVTIRNWSSDPSENPVAVFIGDQKIGDYYNVEYAKEIFTLMPKNQNSGFSEIQLEFAKGLPETMVITDNLGQITRIAFSDIKEGVIPKNPYQFDIPVNADVIYDG